MDTIKRKNIDYLIEQFWKNGYLTLSRKFGTYLPEPEKIGGFDVDIIAKQGKEYALGITISEEDFRDPKLLDRISFLATRKTKFTQKQVLLYIGIPEEHLLLAKGLIDSLSNDIKTNIKLFSLADKSLPPLTRSKNSRKVPIA
ncbi:MAG TPA: hypothetical protein VI230_01460 [Ignavibacteriaceae bacterium]